jgi:hypothetical protein
MPQLTVHNAQISTAAVEIKTLTLGGKQVTLAVFRQLREEQLIAYDGSLFGIPWGTVNYHPDKCADDNDHLHVVWQQGTELRRAYVEKPPRRAERKPVDGELVRRWRDAALVEGWQPNVEAPRWPTERKQALSVEFGGESGGCLVRVPLDGSAQDALWPYSYAPDTENERQRMRDEALAAIRDRAFGDLPSSDLAAQIAAGGAAYDLRCERIHDQWKALNDLPQLFIAV